MRGWASGWSQAMGCNPTFMVFHPIDEREFRVRAVRALFSETCCWTGRWGEDPIGTVAEVRYLAAMNLLLLILVLLLLFGGGGFYLGGPVVGGGGVGLILLVCLIIFMMGGFRTRRI